MILDENYYKELEKAASLPKYIQQLRYDEEGEHHVFGFNMVIPFWRVVIYATLHEKSMFEAIMNEVLSAKMPDYFNERLDAKQLYRILCMVDEDCLHSILNKLEGADSVYNRLLNSVNDQNEAGFNEIINDGTTDTKPVIKICNCLRLLYEFYDGVDEFIRDYKKLEEAKKSSGDDLNRFLATYIEKALYKIRLVLSGDDYTDETHKIINKIVKALKTGIDIALKNNGDEVIILKEINNGLAEIKIPTIDFQDLVHLLYDVMLYLYFYMRDGSELKTSNYTLEVLREIILTPQQKEIWSKYDTSDNAHQEFKSVLDQTINKIIAQQETSLQSTRRQDDIKKDVRMEAIASNTSEAEQLFGTIKVIIGALPDSMFDKKKGKEAVIELFDRLLLNKFDGGIDANQYDLLNDLSALRGGRHSKYEYNGLNLKAFVEVIGYLIRKKIICAKPADVANEIVSAVPTDVFKKCKGIPQDTLASYIGNGVNSKKEYKKRWALIDSVLKIK